MTGADISRLPVKAVSAGDLCRLRCQFEFVMVSRYAHLVPNLALGEAGHDGHFRYVSP
jgi:hypothetical protein